MGNCNENNCCTEDGSCQSSSTSCESNECCPIEVAADMWSDSFCEAMREVQVDILKEKIRKSWGPMMEQAADMLLESKGACWESMIAKVKLAHAENNFKQKLTDLWLNASNCKK